MRRPQHALPALLLALCLPATAQEAEAAKDLFMTHCAMCHGENGNGKGTTELDRPARSFLDGGFSYGNTEEAIRRTLTFGIPGTPMPAFDAALSEDQRAMLARYVISLGPKGTVVRAGETEMVVGDRALIARGFLPPVVQDAPQQPRGALLGLPSGLSFEYRTDDVRLLAIRSGRFVDRRDWRGRGGDSLQPMGRIVELVGGGQPEAPWLIAEPTAGAQARPLGAAMRTSLMRGPMAGIGYELVQDGASRGFVMETVNHFAGEAGVGWRRTFTVKNGTPDRVLRFNGLDPIAGPLEAFETDLRPALDGHTDQLYAVQSWVVQKVETGVQVTVVRSFDFLMQGGAVPGPLGDIGFWVWPAERDVVVDVTRVTCRTWDEPTKLQLMKDLSQ